jgi:hypothetical protein
MSTSTNKPNPRKSRIRRLTTTLSLLAVTAAVLPPTVSARGDGGSVYCNRSPIDRLAWAPGAAAPSCDGTPAPGMVSGRSATDRLAWDARP